MDLDADGRPDIISGSWPGEIYFFRRLPDGSFAAAVQLCNLEGKPINVGYASSAFAVDWDASGMLDLLVGNLAGEVHLLRGHAKGGKLAFGPPERLSAGGQPIQAAGGDAAPVAADWDDDGLLDLILGAEDGSVVWFRNRGTREQPDLEAARELVPTSPAQWRDDSRLRPGEWGIRVKPCVVDWNGDGRLDLLLGDRCGSFQAKPSQLDEEVEEEQQANDVLPQLRQAWTKAFAEFQQLSGAEVGEDAAAARRLEEVRARLARLKDEIARVQEIQAHYRSGWQAHGFVWLFLRK